MARWKKVLLWGAGGLLITLAVVTLGFIGYVEASSGSRMSYPETPYPDIHASRDPAVIARGHELVFGAAHCVSCHGDYEREHPEALRRDVPLTGGLLLAPPFGSFYPPNITSDEETGIGAWSDAELARVIRTGVRRDGELSFFMKFSVGNLTDEDLTAVVSYLRSTAPVRHVVPPSEPNFMARAMSVLVELTPDPNVAPTGVTEGEASVERGRYLATGPAACVACHSPVSPDNPLALWEGHELSGGDPMPSEVDPSMELSPPNLTPDPETGITGQWDEERFVARFASGARVHADSIMPWECFGRMPETDLRALYRYLRSLPAVRRDTGPSYRPTGSFTPAP